MLGMMRRSRQRAARPCPCGGSCLCHKPVKIDWILLLCLLPIAALVGLVFLFPPKPEKRTIHVNGKVCDVVFVVTERRCTSTGACHDEGYDEAVCPR